VEELEKVFKSCSFCGQLEHFDVEPSSLQSKLHEFIHIDENSTEYQQALMEDADNEFSDKC